MTAVQFALWVVLSGQICFAASPGWSRGQQDSDNLAPGLFLVAPRHAADRSFAETVVLLLHHDQTGTLGVVINRPTNIAISRVFGDTKPAKHINDSAYAGGPVQAEAVLALYRSNKKIDEAAPVFADVYLISTKTALDRVFSSKPTAKNFRVYLGYTGWAPGQLEHEMELEMWRVLPGDSDSVFDADPSSVWPRLIERTEMRYAGLFSDPRSKHFAASR
ncbi:MAG: YqgE/AlgH family protein [Bryobacteraceae bacterium]